MVESIATVELDEPHQYDQGRNPALAVWGGRTVVEVHKSQKRNDLWYRLGQLEGYEVDWKSSNGKYDTGRDPQIAVRDDGIVLEVHRSHHEDKLFYRTGRLKTSRSQWSIDWDGSHRYTSGKFADVAVRGDLVVEVHEAGNHQLFYRLGVLRPGSDQPISWFSTDGVFDLAYTAGGGRRPSVAFAPDGSVVEIHESEQGGQLWCRVGAVKSLGNGLYGLQWGSGRKIGNGKLPSIAVAADGTVLEVHQSENHDTLWRRSGTIDHAQQVIEWGKSYKYADGRTPRVAFSDKGRAVAVHRAKSGDGLHHTTAGRVSAPTKTSGTGKEGEVEVDTDAWVFAVRAETWPQGVVPDLRPGDSELAEVADDKRIDVVFMADGYRLDEISDFQNAFEGWLDDFLDLDVLNRFRGAFRIRAVFTPSGTRASSHETSLFGVRTNSSGSSMSTDEEFWKGDRFKAAFRAALDALDEVGGVNEATYPEDLYESEPYHSHLVVSLLARSSSSRSIGSGVHRRVSIDGRRTSVGFCENSLHEFGHALARVEDEYIGNFGVGSARSGALSVFDKGLNVIGHENPAATAPPDPLPWHHLSPLGSVLPRDRSSQPVVGGAWRGARQLNNRWRAEYRCKMNGSSLFIYRADLDDPVLIRQDKIDLRTGRLCLWCQEVFAMRILEKIGHLAGEGDPVDPADYSEELGVAWYQKWEDEIRPQYLEVFAVADEISRREDWYKDPENLPEALDGAPLWESKLYDSTFEE